MFGRKPFRQNTSGRMPHLVDTMFRRQRHLADTMFRRLCHLVEYEKWWKFVEIWSKTDLYRKMFTCFLYLQQKFRFSQRQYVTRVYQ